MKISISPKISVLTPTIRPESLGITRDTLANQTFQDFEWLVEVGFPDRGFTLPSDLNKMLKRANGELIVFLQDYIRIEPDALEKMWQKYQENPKALITAPVGKVKDWDEKPRYDWRAHVYFDEKLSFNKWEIDWGAAPRKAFFEVGGFDEAFNEGWSWENVEIAARLQQLGYTVHCDPDNKTTALDHDTFMEHPFRNKENNSRRCNETVQRASSGRYKLEFL